MSEFIELLRYSSNAWGQRTLEGVSWDLLPVFVGLAVVFIVGHALLAHFLGRKD
ncbi:MAG: hypothetical protein WD750_08595 [Gammaproteobacteria bacterium]